MNMDYVLEHLWQIIKSLTVVIAPVFYGQINEYYFCTLLNNYIEGTRVNSIKSLQLTRIESIITIDLKKLKWLNNL